MATKKKAKKGTPKKRVQMRVAVGRDGKPSQTTFQHSDGSVTTTTCGEDKAAKKSPVSRVKKLMQSKKEALATHNKFREVWERLSKKGICDAIDGVEYTRVIGEWVDAKTPENIADFIQEHAAGPEPTDEELDLENLGPDVTDNSDDDPQSIELAKKMLTEGWSIQDVAFRRGMTMKKVRELEKELTAAPATA